MAQTAPGTLPRAESHFSDWSGPRRYRYGALALALLGLLALWMAARSAPIQTIRVRDITSTMNWAYVRVQGTVADYPTYDTRSGRLSFRVDDGTGEIVIVSYRNESQALIDTDRVPSIGDQVSAEGELRVSQEYQSLALRVPRGLVLDRATAVDYQIGDISAKQVHQKVLLRGQVRKARSPYEGLVLLTLCDGTGEIDVACDLSALTHDAVLEAAPGDSVLVRGVVTLYRGEPQIAPIARDGVKLLQEVVEIAVPRNAAQIEPDDIGRIVRIQGTISAIQRVPSGLKIVIEDSTGSVPAVVWNSVLDPMTERPELAIGMEIDVQGRVAEYGDELEVVPELVTDIRAIGVPETPMAQVPMAELSVSHLGQTVVTEGQVVRVQPFSGGTWFEFRNGGATLLLVFWQELYDVCPDKHHLVPGARISVQGVVQAYEGSLKIVPDRSGDVVFLSMDVLPSAGRRATGSLSNQHIGQRWEIEGHIVDIQYLTTAERWLIDDGSGRIAVRVWNSVTEPFSVTFKVGTLLAVTGEVTDRRGLLELIPDGPEDLKWLGQGLLPTPTQFATARVQPSPTVEATACVTPTATVTVRPTPTPSPTPTRGITVARTGDVSKARPGSALTSQGRIVDARAFASGVKFQIDDGSGSTAVWVPSEIFGRVSSVRCWVIGGTVRVTGLVQLYKDEIEIVPLSAELAICAAQPQPVEVVPIANLQTMTKGQRAVVAGKILEAISFSKGIKYVLEDSSGRVILLLWQDVLDLVTDRDRLVAGAIIQVAGTVDEYQGELQIAPCVGADIAFR